MSSKSLKVKSFLEKTHNIQITDFHLKIDRNAGNLFDKEFSHSGSYTCKELGYRKAEVKLYFEDNDKIDIIYDTFLQEKICIDIDQKIEKNITDIDFVIYVQVMGTFSPKEPFLNQDVSEIREEFFKDKSLKTRVLVNAPDFKENRVKYLQFHIDIMGELKAQQVEKCKLYFKFFDDNIDVSTLRIDTQTVVAKPEKEYVIEDWYSIHNNKWYDMVKDHPDKVLKYGKVFTYK